MDEGIDDIRQDLADPAHDAAGAIRRLAAARPIDVLDAVDLLERAACYGRVDAVETLYEAVGDFAYESWALTLALRCGELETARCLISHGADLLAEPRRPRGCSGPMPLDERLTRFALTRRSPTLFLNPMDPTAATAAFTGFRRSELLEGPYYERPTDLQTTCACIAALAREDAFADDAFDDLARAAAVRAWHALRHERERDEKSAAICLGLVREMLAIKRASGRDASRLERLLGALLVPRGPREVSEFVVEEVPDAFFGALDDDSWLVGERALVEDLAAHLTGGPEDGRARLACLLAGWGDRVLLESVLSWAPLGPDSLGEAARAASAAGHAELAAFLLARQADARRGASGAEDDGLGAGMPSGLDDLLL